MEAHGTGGRRRSETESRPGAWGVADRSGWRSRLWLTSVATAGASALLGMTPARAEEPRPAATEPVATVAAETAAPLAAALERLQPGQSVRIATAGNAKAEGRFTAVREGRLLLEDSKLAARFPDGVPLENVQKAWVRGRGTKTGAIVGGAVGGAATAALFGFFVYAMCEVDSCRDDWPTGAAIGLAVGGTAGALTGGLIGSASPQWHTLPGGMPSVFTPGASRRNPIGSASLQLGYGRGLDGIAPGGAAGWRLSLAREGGAIGPNLEIRPSLEIGRQILGQRWNPAPNGERAAYRESMTYLGPAFAVAPARGAVQPYALASAGFYRWHAVDPISLEQLEEGYAPTLDHDFLGASLGGGLRIDTGRPLSFGVEGRWHTNLTRGPYVEGSYRRLSALSITGGATLRW